MTLTYENAPLMQAMAAAALKMAQPDEFVIVRQPFRWMLCKSANPDTWHKWEAMEVICNAYEGVELEYICEHLEQWEIVHNFHHVGIMRKKP